MQIQIAPRGLQWEGFFRFSTLRQSPYLCLEWSHSLCLLLIWAWRRSFLTVRKVQGPAHYMNSKSIEFRWLFSLDYSYFLWTWWVDLIVLSALLIHLLLWISLKFWMHMVLKQSNFCIKWSLSYIFKAVFSFNCWALVLPL